jgi:hypothetical protein
MPKVHVFGGGTVFHVRPHLALSAPAYGATARRIIELLEELSAWQESSHLHLTRMADHRSKMETNADVAKRLDEVVADPLTKIIFMNVALCDFEGSVLELNPNNDEDSALAGIYQPTWVPTPNGKKQPRLKSTGTPQLQLTPADKLIGNIRKTRKDIFLVGFKTTAGATPNDQYFSGLGLLKKASCNLVLANDVHTRLNMVITPEQARYHETTDREEALHGLVEMAVLRSRLTFTRSEIIPGDPVRWDSTSVPESLRTVVNHCISRGAYKPFNGATVGHFAFKVNKDQFITSRRKVDFNKLPEIGMVLVQSAGPDSVVAHGFKPSVGGMSQRIIFSEHPDVDCIVHAHVPLKPGSKIPVRSQREYECGSHECGKNTSDGLQNFGGIRAVMLDKHGPNIVFHRSTDPKKVIDFIEQNFDLTGRTDSAA